MKLVRKLCALFRKETLDAEMAEEMRAHLEMQIAQNIARGMSAGEARYAAQRQFGHVDGIKERCRDQRLMRWIEYPIQGVRTGLRSLRSNPVYVVTSVGVLGVSLAALLTITAMLDALLVRPPSARAPQELVFVGSSLPRAVVSYPDFVDLGQRSKTLTHLFAYDRAAKVGLQAGGQHAVGRSLAVSGSFFPALECGCAEGRLLTDADDVAGAEPVAVVTSALRNELKLTVGGFLSINDRPFRVIGVLPPDHRDIDRAARPDVWIALQDCTIYRPALVLNNRNYQALRLGGRIAAGSGMAEVGAELGVLARQLQQENAAVNHGMTLEAHSFPSMRFANDETVRTLVVLGAIVWFLFALGFTNFHALTLLRLFQRRREIAIRVALGATRSDLGRWLLGEFGFVLALALAVGGLLSYGLIALLEIDARVGGLVDRVGIKIDFRAAGVAVVSAMLAGGVIWLLVLSKAVRPDLVSAIKESGSAPRRQSTFLVLFGVQFALALFLATLSLSFVGALRQTMARQLPFKIERSLIFSADLRTVGWGMDREKSLQFQRSLLTALQEIPGIRTTGATDAAPLEGAGWTNIEVDGRDPSLEPDKGQCDYSICSPDYFAALGLPMLRGRTFTEREVTDRAASVIVNQSMASRYWPTRDPVGRNFSFAGRSFTVVGVAADFPAGRESSVRPRFFRPFSWNPTSVLTFVLAVQNDTPALRQAIIAKLRSLWPDENVPEIRTMSEHVTASWADLGTAVRIVLGVAGFATLITGCGIYFFSAYTTAQTLRDSAIRIALGATTRDVTRDHLRRYRWGIAAGILLGGAFVAASVPILRRIDIALTRPELASFGAAASVITAIAVLGLWLPVRRLKRIDPMIALRCE